MIRLRRLALASVMCLLILGASGAAEGATLLVRQDGTGDYTLIRPGISAAMNGDTVLVGPGEYYEPTIEIRKPVHLISEEGPIVTTIRMYSGWGMECVTVVYISDVTDPCTVEGFTIRGARDGYADAGGGISILRSKATIRNNIITDNWCSTGGGIYCSGDVPAVIEYNLITLNEAVTGGGITIYSGSHIIRNNTIVYNWASITDGGIRLYAEGIAGTIIANNIIAKNESASSGIGGVGGFITEADIEFTCNDVWNNTPRNYQDSLQVMTGREGNISVDPLFCGEWQSGNYYLQAASPCTGPWCVDSCGVPYIGCYPVNCTTAAAERSWGGIKGLLRDR